MKPNDMPLSILRRSDGVSVAKLIAVHEHGSAWVVLEGSESPVAAESTVDLQHREVGCQVVVAFIDGDPRRPIVMGRLRGQDGRAIAADAPSAVEIDADGHSMAIVAQRELVLRCGRASIRLSAEGRIEIRGDALVSEAKGVNRIRGGSVQLN